MDNLRTGGKGKEKVRGIYIGLDREGRVPLLCNCNSCKKQRKKWGEKPVARIEYVPVKEKVKELADNNINLILASIPGEILYPSLFPLEKGLSSMIDYIKDRGVKPFEYHLDLEIITEMTPKTWKNKLF